jgi:hypothetical protein
MLKVAIIQDQRKLKPCWVRACVAMGPDWTIVGEAGSVQEGITLIYATHPDLVIINPALPDGSGFAIFEATTTLEYRKVLLSEGSRHRIKAARYNAALLPACMPEGELGRSLVLLHACLNSASVQQTYQVQSTPPKRLQLDFCTIQNGLGRIGFWVSSLTAIVPEGNLHRVTLKTGNSWVTAQRFSSLHCTLAGHPISSNQRDTIIYLPQVQDLDANTQAPSVLFFNGESLAIERAFLPILKYDLDRFQQSDAHGRRLD